MDKFQRNIKVIIYYLNKIHRHALIRQSELFKIKDKNDAYKIDNRIISFGLLRTIIFCAINDVYNLEQNINEGKFLTIKEELNEPSDKQFLQLAIENYPIYNYIIRIQSIIETGTRCFLSECEFGKYLQELDEPKRNACQIIKAWRNTIHNNGLHKKEEEQYSYYGKNIVIPKDKIFEFEFWTLYRISIDLIDVLFEFCKKSFEVNPYVLSNLYIEKTGSNKPAAEARRGK